MVTKLDFAKKKAVAATAMLSSKFEELRRQKLEAGDVPWSILQYQRVVEPDEFPLPLRRDGFTTPLLFEKHCKYIATKCKPISLSNLIDLINNNAPIPDKTVVVTLDGGHSDNYLQAFPVLLRYQIPATFFLPTYYIGNDTFFFEDRLVYLLTQLVKASHPLPEFKHLEPELKAQLSELSPEGHITEPIVHHLVAAMRTAVPEERLSVMAELADFLHITGTLPEFEDFMRWDDVRHIKSMGFSVGSMGHASVSTPTACAEDFLADLGSSIQKFEEENIEFEPCININHTGVPAEVIAGLRQINCDYVISNGYYPEPRFQTVLPLLLGRTPISEIDSFSVDVFACRMWGLEISGIQF